MTLLRKTLELLDRPGTRGLLARVATWHARKTAPSARVFYDSVWLHEFDGTYWADSRRFSYFGPTASQWSQHNPIADRLARNYWFHLSTPQDGDVIIDIGAGDGGDIPTFSKAAGPNGRVIAIEAHPETFNLLERMVHWNQLPNVTCIQKAMLADSRESFLTTVDEHVSNAITSRPDEGAVRVNGTTLDDFCEAEQIEEIALLKMNIEGAEREAIRGMSRMIRQSRFVCIACHDFRADRGESEEFRTREVVKEFLADNGLLVVERLKERPEIRDHIHAWNPELVSEPPISQS